MTMGPEHQHIKALHDAEMARAVARQLIANGQQKLTPEVIEAMHELDENIAKSRQYLGLNRRG